MQQAGLPELLARVLAARGVGPEEAASYLAPTLRESLPDPSIFRDMDAAAERLAQALRAGEGIAIFGDYDVDGATSTALLMRFLREAGADPTAYIPDRQKEGYGPNIAALRKLAAGGVNVVVTVDCGTSAFEAIAAGREAGLDLIICDHHLAETRLPDCLVVNPNRIDETAGHRQLAAVGVAFLLAVAVNRALRRLGHYGSDRPEPRLTEHLDLVALGTVADVVPLTGLNRALVTQGLKVLARRAKAGLRALCDVARLQEPPATYHLGYLLGPRVNAGGRVGRSDLGARLLATDDPAEAVLIAADLDRLNTERRAIEAEVENQALAAVGPDPTAPFLLVAGEGWHSGVIGIVASRLKDRFDRPVLVAALENGIAKASGRSVRGIDLGAAVGAARQAGLLINGGGHPMAAGLTVEAGRLDGLRAFLGERLAPALAARAPSRVFRLDGVLAPGGATLDLVEGLERAGPYGAGNPDPRFALVGAKVVKADVVGERHVRVIASGEDGGRVKGIAFRAIDNALGAALLKPGKTWHLAGRLRRSWFRGEAQVDFEIEDAAPSLQ
ncbi:MAG: single-stranded-DNA-specific exonuclease RecJ [Alphaproteobacteria bacterium]|nr:single-stranded-DNA-specific exonuclease RecJ [Alphaproteobacteria bacterium]